MKELLDQLTALYEGNDVLRVFTRVQEMLHNYRTRIPARNGKITEHDSPLITYGDQIQTQNEKPLQMLNKFCEKYLANVVSRIHILPFYPWTSDDGFSLYDDNFHGPNEKLHLPAWKRGMTALVRYFHNLVEEK